MTMLPPIQTPYLDSLEQYTEVSDYVAPRFSTGIPFLDKIFKNEDQFGFECAMYILAGDPGCGKTSLALELLRNFAEAGHRVFYGAYEGRNNVWGVMRRMGIKSKIVVVDGSIPGWEPDADTLCKRMVQIGCENYTGKPAVMVIDSIKNLGTGSIAARREAAEKLYKACYDTNTILIVIAHATKDSIGKKNKKLEGPAELLGLSDAMIYLVGGVPVDGARPVSIDTQQKSRLCEPGVFSGPLLTAKGFVWPARKQVAITYSSVDELDAEIATTLAKVNG